MKDLSQVVFSVPGGVAEAVARLLTEEGGGLEQRDAETSPGLPPQTTELVAWLPASTVEGRVKQVEKLLASLKELGETIDPWSWRSEEADPEAWVDAYKRHFKTTRIGRHFLVKPSWEKLETQGRDLVIELDPGMAFGTGLHASTRLVIKAIERLAMQQAAPKSVLDLGCGTGILAIAAARLWPASRVVAVDNDPVAVQVCRENAQRNGLDGRILVEQRSAREVRGTFSLVLANLSADVLTELQPTMRRSLEVSGHLVLSGLTGEQAPAVTRGYCKALVMEPLYTEEEDGWRAVLLEVRQ